MFRKNSDFRRIFVTKRVVLSGFMASGKSTLAKHLAQKMGWKFFDIDAELTRILGKPPARIFQDHGEGFFRAQESLCLQRLLLRSSHCMIAVGGGSILRFENREQIRKNSLWIHLEVAPKLVWERLKNDFTRPLAPRDFESLQAMMKRRRVFSETAPHLLFTEGFDEQALCAKIFHRLKNQNLSAKTRRV